MSHIITNSYGCSLCSHEGKVAKATRKVAEESNHFGHPLTNYLCEKHFRMLMTGVPLRKRAYYICA